MNSSTLLAAVCAVLPIQGALSQNAVPITNVTIDMVRHAGKGGFSDRCKDFKPKRVRRF